MRFIKNLIIILFIFCSVLSANIVKAQMSYQKNNTTLQQTDVTSLYTLIMNREDALSDKMLNYSNQSLQHAKDTINYFLIILSVIATVTAVVGWKTFRDVKNNTRSKIEEIAKKEITKFTEKLEVKMNKLDEKVEENMRNSLAWSKFKETKDLNEKYDLLEKLIQENPDDAFLYYQKGGLLSEMKKYDEAIQAIDRAIEIKPKESVAFFLKSNCLSEMKKYDEAIQAIDRAIEIKPKSEYFERKAGIYLELQQYESAIKFYEKARHIELKESDGKCDDYAGYFINISFCYHNLRQFGIAYDKARNGLTFGFRLELLVNKGLAAAGLNRREEAIESLNMALETEVRKNEVIYCYARVFSLLKDYDNAFEYLKLAIINDIKFLEMAKVENDFNFIANSEDFKKITESKLDSSSLETHQKDF